MDYNDIKIKKDPIIIFMGTPEFASCVLEGLLEHYKIRAIVTQPDKKVGRGGNVKYSPVKEVALKNNILCLQPDNIASSLEEIHVLEPDLIITCAYGQILPLELLQIPKLGCINVHASLLPKLRGGAPIHRAIMEGYTVSGVTIMYMDTGMDTGDMISKKEVVIDSFDTAEILHDKLKVVGRDLLLETLPSIIDGTNKREKQNEEEATYAPIISKEDEKIDFTKNVRTIINQIRGLNSFPGSYCIFEGKRMKVWKARALENIYDTKLPGEITNIYSDGFGVKVQNGEVVFTEIQLEGKGKMSAASFINGHGNLVGTVLN